MERCPQCVGDVYFGFPTLRLARSLVNSALPMTQLHAILLAEQREREAHAQPGHACIGCAARKAIARAEVGTEVSLSEIDLRDPRTRADFKAALAAIKRERQRIDNEAAALLVRDGLWQRSGLQH